MDENMKSAMMGFVFNDENMKSVIMGLVFIVVGWIFWSRHKKGNEYILNKYNIQNKEKYTLYINDGTQIKEELLNTKAYIWRENDELSFVSTTEIGDFGKLSFKLDEIEHYKSNDDEGNTCELIVNVGGYEKKMILATSIGILSEVIFGTDYQKSHLEKYNPNGHSMATVAMHNAEMLLNGMKKSVRQFIWREGNKIVFISEHPKDDYGKVDIEIGNIKFFKRFGEVYTEQIISGGGSDYGQAIVARMLRDETDAIIRSRKEIKTENVRIDERQTIMCVKKDEQDIYLKFDSNDYDELMNLIPEKEISMAGL